MNFDVRSRTVFVQPESQSAVMLEIGRLTRSIHIATPLRVSLWFSRALDDTDVEEGGGVNTECVCSGMFSFMNGSSDVTHNQTIG